MNIYLEKEYIYIYIYEYTYMIKQSEVRHATDILLPQCAQKELALRGRTTNSAHLSKSSGRLPSSQLVPSSVQQNRSCCRHIWDISETVISKYISHYQSMPVYSARVPLIIKPCRYTQRGFTSLLNHVGILGRPCRYIQRVLSS